MAVAQEFETTAVSPQQLQEARKFAASYAGEHVAGTEFVIGALFVAWGVSTHDILYGLLLGNLMAVLTWGLVTAPIATDTRLTLYAYLEKIAPRFSIHRPPRARLRDARERHLRGRRRGPIWHGTRRERRDDGRTGRRSHG